MRVSRQCRRPYIQITDLHNIGRGFESYLAIRDVQVADSVGVGKQDSLCTVFDGSFKLTRALLKDNVSIYKSPYLTLGK